MFRKYRDFRFLLQGAYGEVKVIEHIRSLYSTNNDYHLINGFDLDIIGKALSFKDHTLVENKLDHVLICPKGIFIMETKAWKTVTEEGRSKVAEQLEKIHYVFTSLFDKKIEMKNVRILLVTTEQSIETGEHDYADSIQLSNLGGYLDERPDIFVKDQITLALNAFLPYMGQEHVNTLSRIGIKAGGLMTNLKMKLFKGKGDRKI